MNLSKLLSAVLCAPIMVYRWVISPLWPAQCRFYPSCSAYGKTALMQHGPRRGLWLTAKRIVRCHPWGGSGVDPVPPPQS